MEIIALINVIATIMNVEGNLARIDSGLAAGIRLGDVAEVYYLTRVGSDPIGSDKKRVVVNRGEVIEIDEFTALLEVEPEFTVMTGYSVEFEVPQNRIAPIGIVDQARARLEEKVTVATLRTLIDRLVPEDEFVEQQFLRLLEERRRQRGEPAGSGPTGESPAPDAAGPGETGGAVFRYQGEYQEPEILAMVQAWAEAWAGQEVESYLGFYARGFRPARGLDRSAWERQRRTRVAQPRFIRLELVFLEARSIDVGRGWAEFEQTYRSNSYRDRVTKRLDLVWEGDDWKIERESVLE